MLKIERVRQSLISMESPTLADVSITERYDLQQFICNSSDAFFEEINEKLFLVSEELQPSEKVGDRIDLLAVDKEGACVIIELKRGNNKLHMLQAISYAGMISSWDADQILELLSSEQQERLTDFLDVELDAINRTQRIILIAEAFDYALLVGAEWLNETYDVNISCCRLALAKDADSDAEFLVCSNVYPNPELADVAIRRGATKVSRSIKWKDWKEALAGVGNSAVSDFFNLELSDDCESYLLKRILRYRIDGKRRWHVSARSQLAYVWQGGRFDDDVEFWKDKLSDPGEVKVVKDGAAVRMHLKTAKDFRVFKESVIGELTAVDWCEAVLTSAD